jgi:hypothetical protein
MTRAQLTTMARQFADAVNSPRWSDPTIQSLLGQHQWNETGKLLNAFNQYYINGGAGDLTVTQDAKGQFNWSDLTTGTGDDVKNVYRVLTLGQPSGGGANGTSGPLFYANVPYTRFPNPQPSTSLPYVWYRIGSKVQILPAVQGQILQAVVNYRPCRVENLASDDSEVPFPDGYEMLLAYLAGAAMLDFGGAEAGAANVLLANAEGLRSDMMLDLGRYSTQPILAQAFDDPQAWGGGGY